MQARRILGVVSLSLLALVAARADDPLQSSLQPGAKPGPYSSICITGPNRGTSHCFICETADKPAVVILARSMSDPLGKLAQKIDKAVGDNKKADLQGWMTYMAPDHVPLDAKLRDWAKTHAIGTLPIAVFEDKDGPPSYRIAEQADVTVLLFVQQKVVANFSFRRGELNDARTADVLKALPMILEKK